MRKLLIATVALSSLAMATPAFACGSCTSSSTSSTSSTSSGGTSVPEPGMFGLMGAGVLALAIARRRAKTNALRAAADHEIRSDV
ncbi:MAG: PEP-CTERM sorting domain-containing protein [Novosphingobium sp.]|nr:PEP-CTERM sorting domain-containing protein [Novosphingobium sp.]